jgi:hypothetical protein
MPTNSNQDYTSLKQSNAQAITDITHLQEIEKRLFDTLEQSLSQGTLTTPQKDSLVQQINQISQMRSNVYQTIGGVNMFYTQNLNTASDTLADQTQAIQIVEKELNAAKKRLREIQDYKLNKLRLVEINTYYGERYAAHTHIMKLIIFTFVPILILAYLQNKGYISNWLFSYLTIIIGFIGVCFLLYNIRSIYLRDNMMFHEYDWGFNPDSAPKAGISGKFVDPWALGGSNICIGQACCDEGYTYNSAQNKCIPTSQDSAESFVSDIFTKYQRQAENKKPDYIMGDKLPVSYGST